MALEVIEGSPLPREVIRPSLPSPPGRMRGEGVVVEAGTAAREGGANVAVAATPGRRGVAVAAGEQQTTHQDGGNICRFHHASRREYPPPYARALSAVDANIYRG